MIHFRKVAYNDLAVVQQFQRQSFKALLNKYQDVATNPANDTLERLQQRFSEAENQYYFIEDGTEIVGVLRTIKIDAMTQRISPLFILPQFQGKGYAQAALQAIENEYPDTQKWQIQTIRQEEKLVYLYEKSGYVLTRDEQIITNEMSLCHLEKQIIVDN